MATKNSVNNKTGSLTLDPGASGDPFVQLSINADDKFIYGVDDSDADKFKIADANSLATANLFVMTAAGERTMPLQPAFLAYNSVTDTNVGGGTTLLVTVQCDTEIFDQNSDYNNSTYTFTAPVTGRYRFIAGFKLEDVGTCYKSYIDIVTTQYTYRHDSKSPTALANVSDEIGYCGSATVQMDAADTAILQARMEGAGGDTVDIYGGSSPIATFFGGFLVC